MASPGENPTTTTPGGTSTWAKARNTSDNMIKQSAIEDVESRVVKLLKENHEFKTKLSEKDEKLSEKTARVEKLLADLEAANSNLATTRSDLTSKTVECKTLEESSKSTGERVDRQAAETDLLREEISRLTKSNLEYKEKLVGLESQAKLGESEAIPLKFQVDRLTREMDSVTTHSKWLESELSTKTEELKVLKSSHASEISGLRSELDAAIAEKELSAGQSRNLNTAVDKLQTRNERLSAELRDIRRTSTDEKLTLKENLVSTERLANLYKEQLQQLQQGYDSTAKQMESLQQLAKEAEQDSDRELKERERALEAKAKKVLEGQAQDYQKRIGDLTEQLEAAQKRYKQAEEGILLTDVPARTSTPLKLLTNTGDDSEPVSLTDLHTRLAQVQDALNNETLKRRKAEILYQRVFAEIEANAPMLARQRQEYELAMQQKEDYRTRLEESFAERQSARDETSALSLQTSRLLKENKELKEEVTEMAKQVQTLLVSRSTGGDVSGGVPNSVVEIQTQNQQLLKEHRRMTATINELRHKLDSDDLSRKVESYEGEIATLREQRKEQESMVEQIARQRDLYRAMLSNQDGNLLGSQEETSALQVLKQQSDRSKNLEQQKKHLETELAKSRAEAGSFSSEVEATKERLARYESLNSELTGSVDRLQLQVIASKAQVARSEADASFHKEKCTRLEEKVERISNELTHVTASKNEMQRINASLQTSVSKANAEASRMEGELSQANVKLRLAETQTATAKQSEQRLVDENNQLRLENSKQGGLTETMMRLEAKLTARSAAEADGLKDEILSLKEKIARDEKAHASELAKVKGTVSDQEACIKDLEKQKNDALRDTLKAKKDHLEAASELQKANIKIKTIESQLRVAKKKLGETVDDKDTEGDLSAKVISLTAELEAKRAEAETLKERVSTYEKLAKDNEVALAELSKATKSSNAAEAEEVQRLTTELESFRAESKKRKELITELTNDLAKNRDEITATTEEHNKKMAGLRAEAEAHQKAAQSAEDRYAKLYLEVSGLKQEMSSTQNNYERELALHATARTELRASREEAEAEIRLRKIAEEHVVSVKSELDGKVMQLEEQKVALEKNLTDSEKILTDTRAQNKVLHDQLENLGDRLEKMQAGKELENTDETPAEGSTDNQLNMKTITDLREVVKYVRSENEMIQTQLDEARRAAERERAATAIAKRSLDEAREELRVLQEQSKGHTTAAGGADAMNEKLVNAQEQVQLLKDSNSHLREEVARLEKKSLDLEQEVGALKKSAQPSEKRQQETEAENAALRAEKDSLLREANDWKGRVQSLVSKFNQVDPEEHAQVLKKIEVAEKEVADLKTQKTEAETESKRIRGLASRASTQLQQNKALVETQKKSIAKLTAEKEALIKAQKNAASAKELGEFKAKVTKLESERENEKIQLTGANEMNEKLRNRLREFQKKIIELRKSEASLTAKLKEAQETIDKQKDAPSSGSSPVEAGKETNATAPLQSGPGNDEKVTSEETARAEAKSADTATSEDAKASETTAPPKKTNALPVVPREGFRFGPSPPEDDESAATAETRAKSPVPESTNEEAPKIAVSKKRLATQPAETESQSKKVARGVEASEGGQSTKAETKTEQSSGAAATKLQRRSSGETKEVSIKERLLEKKRKLALAQKKLAQVKKDDADAPAPAPAQKKAKSSSDEPHPSSSPVKEEPKEEEKATEPAKEEPAKDEPEEGEEAEQGEVEETKVSEAKVVEEKATFPVASSTPSTIHNPFGAPAPAPLGSAAQTTTIGGSASGAAPTFGQTSTFGSGATFGSTSFGKKPEGASASASGFGANKAEGTTTATASGFGAFANIKPPGTSPAPPAFSFGTSGSITLPTPSSISPQQTMFNAFSSPNPFNAGGVTTGGVTPLPLFGAKKEEKADEEGKDEETKDE